MTIGTYIKGQRIKTGITQKELSTKLGYSSAQFVSMMERDEASVPWSIIGKLKTYIKVDQKLLEKYVIEHKINKFKARM